MKKPNYCHCGRELVNKTIEYKSTDVYSGELIVTRDYELACPKYGRFSLFQTVHDKYTLNRNGEWFPYVESQAF